MSISSLKDKLEKRVKELFGPDATVDFIYCVQIPEPKGKDRHEVYEMEFALLREFKNIPIDFSYLQEENK